MSFREMLRICCDVAECTNSTSFHENHSAAIADAEARGWLLGVVSPNVDLCPSCKEFLTRDEKVALEDAQSEE